MRLEKFKEKAVPLVSDVARRAIKEAGLDVSDISKLVVVSSTGFLGPGLDCELIKNLGLTRSVDRTLIGFMGCAAAMNGFRNANDYVSVSINNIPLSEDPIEYVVSDFTIIPRILTRFGTSRL